jgi:glutamate-1-semialdehyde 2,1-aminomutase
MKFDEGARWREKAHRLIPGGAHTYAKGDDQFPEEAPAFIVRGKGCRVWDVDGNEFIEYGMGLRAVSLGHAYDRITDRAARAMREGVNFGRPSTLEVECAAALLELVPGAQMVKFAKNGSDATTAAVKLARAHTGRSKVAICADHPFFSTDDWFIGATAMDAGIPAAVRDMTVKFRYNDLESVRELFRRHPGEIACLILEPATAVEPVDGFLARLRDLAHENGSLLVLDEMITGFRWHLGGAQSVYGVTPDLSTFGKAISNGYSLAALVGRRDIMERGGLHHSTDRVFLLSTTHGAETHCLAAALETMSVYREEDVVGFFRRQGEKLRAGIRAEIRAQGVEGFFEVVGHPSNLIYLAKGPDGTPSQDYRTLFLQETIRRGLLMPSLVLSFSHGDEEIRTTIERIGEALAVYRKALQDGVGRFLRGRPVKPVLRKKN